MNKTDKIIEYILIIIIIYILFIKIRSNITINYDLFNGNELFGNYIESNLSNNSKNLIIIPHTELGDAIVMNGAIRYYSSIYDKIIYICRKDYYDQISFMYNDNKNILIYPINLSLDIYTEIDKHIILDNYLINIFNKYNIDFLPLNNFKNIYKSHIINNNININYNNNETSHYPNYMYQDAKLDPIIKYSYFKINRDYNSEKELYNKLINIIGNDYIVIIDDPMRNFNIDTKYIENKQLPIFYLGNKSNNSDMRLNKLHDKYVFNYITILEHAKEIHTIESSIYTLIDQLDIINNIYIHSYVRNGNIDKQVNALTKNKSFKFIYTN